MRYLGAFLLGVAIAWWVQSIRWDTDVLSINEKLLSENNISLSKVNADLAKAQDQAEEDRRKYLISLKEKQDAIDQLEVDVNKPTPVKRLYVRAQCPPVVSSPGSVPSGVGAGTAELDASARPDYFALRRGLVKQYEDLQFCRKTLRERSR